MKSAKLRLALAVGLFVIWVSWLDYLALPSTTPRDVVSRAQLLVSHLDVIATLDAGPNGQPNPLARIDEVCWPAEKASELTGRPLRITNLGFAQGWAGPGAYLLPLQADGTDYQIASVPRSPGYDRISLRIYAATPQIRQQLAHIPKPTAPQ